MLYVFVLPEQTVAAPVIAPGMAGMLFTVTANVCAADDPQLALATTEISPPAALAVAVMDMVVEVPVQPEGNVQV